MRPADDVTTLAERVHATLAELEGVDLAEQPAVFEALDAAILAELRELEDL